MSDYLSFRLAFWTALWYNIYIPIWSCIVPSSEGEGTVQKTAILYQQQYTSKLGDIYYIMAVPSFSAVL